MRKAPVIELLRAMTPEDLLSSYGSGRRDFVGINLLRTELEPVVRDQGYLDCLDDPSGVSSSPLWLDFRLHKELEWDVYGRCLSLEPDALPPARNLSGAILSEVNLSGSYLYPVDFSNADLSHADLRGAIFIDCDLSATNLVKTDLRYARLINCSLKHADLYMARMDRAYLGSCDVRKANLKRAKLRRARLGDDLRGAILDSARCDFVTLCGDLRGIDFSVVQMRGPCIGSIRISARQVRPFLAAVGTKVTQA